MEHEEKVEYARSFKQHGEKILIYTESYKIPDYVAASLEDASAIILQTHNPYFLVLGKDTLNCACYFCTAQGCCIPGAH